MTMIKRSLTLLTFLALAATGTAVAKDDDNRVQRSGSCSGNSNWKLKAEPDDGRLETEFEVDQNRNGVRWTVVLRRNGTKVLETTRTTRAPSGSFEVNARLRNPAGTDRITAVAKRASGETCRGSLRI
jgi:hypothetical protein